MIYLYLYFIIGILLLMFDLWRSPMSDDELKYYGINDALSYYCVLIVSIISWPLAILIAVVAYLKSRRD